MMDGTERMNAMKNKIILVTLSLLFAFGLTGCCMSHEWTEATCTTPKTCSKCGKIEGEVLSHEWVEATCSAPKTCNLCGETEGEALSHEWIEATCSAPKKCSKCGETEGEALAHELSEANYQQPATCSVCGETEGEVLEADFEKYNISYVSETDKENPFINSCNNEDKFTTGKITYSDYKIFESDDTHEAQDGYEWRSVVCTVLFDDENAFNYGYAGYGHISGDYYDMNTFLSAGESDENGDWIFTVNYNGETYENCRERETVIENDWIERDDGTAYAQIKYAFSFCVPVGYDGITMTFMNHETRNKITGSIGTIEDALIYLEDDNTVTFRLK